MLVETACTRIPRSETERLILHTIVPTAVENEIAT